MPAVICWLLSLLGPAPVLPELDAWCVAFGHFVKDCGAGQCQTVLCACSTVMSASAGLGCTQEGPSCAPSPAVTSTGPGEDRHMYQGTPQSASAFLVCWLPVRLIHWKNHWAEGLVDLHEGRSHSDFREGGGYDPILQPGD